MDGATAFIPRRAYIVLFILCTEKNVKYARTFIGLRDGALRFRYQSWKTVLNAYHEYPITFRQADELAESTQRQNTYSGKQQNQEEQHFQS